MTAVSDPGAVEVLTFGCRLNAYESEAMRGLAAHAGQSDALIVNTCAVTAEAERQARQAIRRAAHRLGFIGVEAAAEGQHLDRAGIGHGGHP